MKKFRPCLLTLALLAFGFSILSSCNMPWGMNVKIQNDSSKAVTITMYIGNTNTDGSMIFEEFSCPAHDSEIVPVESSRITVKSYIPSTLKVDLDSGAKTIYVTD